MFGVTSMEMWMGISEGWELVLLGVFLLAGFVAHVVGRRAHVPRVTLLLILGLLAGPSALNIIPGEVMEWFDFITHVALGFVGFLLGEAFGAREHKTGEARLILRVVVAVVVVTLALSTLATWLCGAPLHYALLLGAIATATAPAATLDVIREVKAEGPLTQLLVEVVAVDDAVGVMVFSLAMVAAELSVGGGGGAWMTLAHGAWEIFGAMLLGVVVGFPMTLMLGQLRDAQPTMAEVGGFVLVCSGLAMVLGVSYLLASMAMGAFLARKARHPKRAFHEIEEVSDPFLIIFFFLAGFHLDVGSLLDLGVIGIAFVLSRSAGRIIGGLWGAKGAEPDAYKKIGWCLFPQAGIALGLALIAAHRFPESADLILPVVIAATVIFEMVGPILTRNTLNRAGEIREVSASGDK